MKFDPTPLIRPNVHGPSVTVLTGFHCNQLSFQYCTGTGSSEPDHQDKPRFPGALNSCYTEKLEFDDPEDGGVIPVYRVMGRNGKVYDEELDPKVFISFLFVCFFCRSKK